MSLSITAVICSRNESEYLNNLIPYLAAEDIEVVLIDNGSADGTPDIFTTTAYPNIIEYIHVPFEGVYDWTALLTIKASVYERLDSDWLIHQDADEILHAPNAWGLLRHSIEEANADGFNVLNFNELVMLPMNAHTENYITDNKNYYFFEPHPLRLMRAWRKDANLTNVTTGGHILTGENIKVSPKKMILKHFMVRSQQHAIEKYSQRKFADGDLLKGWHGNRLALTPDMLSFPKNSPHLHRLDTPQSIPECLPHPLKKHYWHWDK